MCSNSRDHSPLLSPPLYVFIAAESALPGWTSYGLANTSTWSNQPLFGLDSYRQSKSRAKPNIDLVDAISWTSSSQNHVYFHDQAYSCGRQRLVEAKSYADVLTVAIESIGEIQIALRDGIVRFRPNKDASAIDVTETVVGPALILALAARRTWCLHASAATVDDRLVAFVGESGNGKSTLARFLGEQAGWSRIADDALPVAFTNNVLNALPRFPQLKLLNNELHTADLPKHQRLQAVYVIAPPDPDTCNLELTELSSAAAAATFVRHTMAARLFNATLLAEHLDFVARAAMRVPVKRLTYPRRWDTLPEIQRLLEQDLSASTL